MGEKAKIILNEYVAKELLQQGRIDVDKFYTADLKLLVSIAQKEMQKLNKYSDFGKRIDNPEKIIMELTEVYCYDSIFGQFSLKDLVDIQNRQGYITLKDISDLYPNKCLKVINETPLGGSIYRYNNYNQKEWIKVGIMHGYA